MIRYASYITVTYNIQDTSWLFPKIYILPRNKACSYKKFSKNPITEAELKKVVEEYKVYCVPDENGEYVPLEGFYFVYLKEHEELKPKHSSGRSKIQRTPKIQPKPYAYRDYLGRRV